jgi:hypothetical protein
MKEEQEKVGCEICFFKGKLSLKDKLVKIIFLVIGCLLIYCQACYWLFANKAEPIVLGMPFSLFFIVSLIVIQFVMLIVFYLIESKETDD